MAGATSTLSTAALRRLKKKRQKENQSKKINDDTVPITTEQVIPEGVTVEYVVAPLSFEEGSEFSNVLSRFTMPENEEETPEEEMTQDQEMFYRGSSDEEEEENGLSKKKLKKVSRLSVAQLKQFASRPEVVEWEDVTAKDPTLLVQLKSVRNSVPVPAHWSRKRKYLAGKRGFVKPPFDLPQFIKDTGIMEIRQSALDEDATKRQKVKAREKMHPKLGKITVDYEKLHNAFFRFQTKPLLTSHGDLYYEGKEFEGRSRDCRPGFLSEELRLALGMGHLAPPPWLHNIQKWGAPPSYPHLRIPGFNAPIPEGAQWGFHPGGWGKPPVDINMGPSTSISGRPDPSKIRLLLTPVDQNIWGELEPDAEDESYFVEEHEQVTDQVHELTLDEDQADAFTAKQEHDMMVGRDGYRPSALPIDGPESVETSRRRR